MKRDVTNVAHSVHDKLHARAQESGESLQRVLERYAIERWIDRLARSSYRDKFVLKGAALFTLWGGAKWRPTRDLDFLGFGSPAPADVAAVFAEVAAIEAPEDGLKFDPASIRTSLIREEKAYPGVRVRLVAKLGRARIPLQVDVAFGGTIEPPPALAAYPTLLGAAAPRVRAYRPETVIAEKFEAAVALGQTNGRMKDFHDLVVLPARFPFNGKDVLRAMRATFRDRRREIPASFAAALPVGFFADASVVSRWEGFLRKTPGLDVPADFAVLGRKIEEFLGPVLEAQAGRRDTRLTWEPGGPWT